MADPIATATVEIIADTSKLTADVKEISDKISSAFKGAASEADAELEKIGGADVWSDLKGEAARAGESIEDDMREARIQSNQELDKISTHSSGAFSKAKLAVAGFSYLGVQAFKSIVGEASNLSESQNAVNVTFGEAAVGISRLGREAAEAVGLSESAFNTLAVQFSAFAETVAGPGGDVVQTMDDLTTRAADFASVMNLDVAEAAQLFQSGLAGETEPLRKFGLDLSAAAVEAYALAEGITAPGEAMTEQQKVQARYGLLMQQTAKTQGDFANTSDGLANQQRILSAKMANLAATLGTALLPILAKVAGFVVDVVIPAIQWMGDNFEFVAAAVIAITAIIVVYNAAAIAAAAATALAMAPWIAAAVAVAALAAGLVWAYQNVDWFREAVQTMWAVVQQVAAFLIDVFVVAFNGVSTAIEWLIGMVQGLWDRAESVRAFLAGAFSLTIEAVTVYIGLWRAAIEIVIGVLQGLWDKSEFVRAFLAGAFKLALDAVKLAFDVLRGAVDLAVEIIGDVWWATEDLRALLAGAFDLAMDAARVAFDLIWTAVDKVITVLGDVWTATEDFRALLAGAAGTALDGAVTAFGKVRDAIQWVIDKLKIAFGWVEDLIEAIGRIKIPKLPGQGQSVMDIVGNATGSIVRQPTLGWTGEGGRPEAIIPMTMPGRAMQLMRESGLGALWSRNQGGGDSYGSVLSIEHATFADATDADLVAQRATAALMAKAIAA